MSGIVRATAGSDTAPAMRVRPAFLPPRETVSVMDAIYGRRAVRNFAGDIVPEAALYALLYAAVQAPSAMHEEPWAFALIQDPALLQEISGASGLCKGGSIFHNAGTLVIIYGRRSSAAASADCWLAASNILLAACGMGLATCIIGQAVDVLNRDAWKDKLDIPPDMQAIAPIVLGVPAEDCAPVSRHPPDILSWIKGP